MISTTPLARLFLITPLLLPITGGQEVVPLAQIESQRAEILRIANDFATVRWQAEGRHSFHGEDDDGVRVDTPDFTLASTSGEVVRLSDYLGNQPVAVVFYRGFF